MKRSFIFLGIVAAISMLTISFGWCHGVDGRVDQVNAYCLMMQYDDGEPMSYAAVEIKAPDSDIAFQTGRTDRNGSFMVKTDTPGAWQAVVSDRMGHRLVLDFTVDAAAKNQLEMEKTIASTVPNQISRSLKVLAGLSIIIGVCGFFYGFRTRRRAFE